MNVKALPSYTNNRREVCFSKAMVGKVNPSPSQKIKMKNKNKNKNIQVQSSVSLYQSLPTNAATSRVSLIMQ